MMCNECTQIWRVIKSMRFIFTKSQTRSLNLKRISHVAHWRFLFLGILSLSALTACGTKDREFPGHSRDQVWKAMVQAADDPRYADWIVVENQVWRDDLNSRLEILRNVRRDVMVSGEAPRREETEWRFSAELTDTDPPAVEFSTSTITVPAHFWLQARHYLDEVDRRLNGMPLEKKAQIQTFSAAESKKLPDRSAPLPVLTTTQSDAAIPTEIPNSRAIEPAKAEAAKAFPIAVAQPEPVVQEQPVAQPVAQPEPVVQEQPIAQPVADPEPVVQEQPIAQPVADPEPVVQEQPIAQPVAQPEPVVQAPPVAQPVAEPEPVVQVPPVVKMEPFTDPTLIPEPVLTPRAVAPAKPASVSKAVPARVASPKVIPVRGPKTEAASVPDPKAAPISKPAPAPIPEPAPVAEPAPAPIPEPIPEPAPIAKPAPVAKPIPVAKPAPAPATEPVEPSPFEPPPEP